MTVTEGTPVLLPLFPPYLLAFILRAYFSLFHKDMTKTVPF
jgi:hypothetical protein